MRWWLECRVPEMGSPKQLHIVTGWGKSRTYSNYAGTGDIRGRVAELLIRLGVPTLPQNNYGRFVVDSAAWRTVES